MRKRFIRSDRRKLFLEMTPNGTRMRFEPPLDIPGYTSVDVEALIPPQADEADVECRFYDIAPWWFRIWRWIKR